jgi:hypothetical protein
MGPADEQQQQSNVPGGHPAGQQQEQRQLAALRQVLSKAILPLNLHQLALVCSAENAEALRQVLNSLYEVLEQPISGSNRQAVSAAATVVSGLLAAAESSQQQQQPRSAVAGSMEAPLVSSGLAGRVLPAGTGTGEVSVAANAARSSSSDSNSFLQQAPYRAAATSDAIRVALAGMMTVLASVWNSNGSKHTLKVSLDSGCNGSCISAELLAQQWHQFFGPGSTAELVELETPLQMAMFAGQETATITHAVRGLQLGIGKGLYTVDLLVVPGANFNLVLGNDFLYNYAGRIWARDYRDRQAGRYLILPLPASLCQPGVEAPRRPAGAGEFWYPSQRIAIDCPVHVQSWRVRLVATAA